MKNQVNFFTKVVLSLSGVSVVSILFNSFAVHLFKNQLFLEREVLTLPGIIVFFGFFFILLFILLSLLWLLQNSRRDGLFKKGKSGLIVLGMFCLVIFIGEKVMADEIGREMHLGWETAGELIIFNILLVIQIIYSVLVYIKLSVHKSVKK